MGEGEAKLTFEKWMEEFIPPDFMAAYKAGTLTFTLDDMKICWENATAHQSARWCAKGENLRMKPIDIKNLIELKPILIGPEEELLRRIVDAIQELDKRTHSLSTEWACKNYRYLEN